MNVRWFARLVWPRLLDLAWSREPDLSIGGKADPYLQRWYVIPRNPVFNVYLHRVLRSDDDRALHDHPWWNLSLILTGFYREITIEAGGIERRVWRRAGDVKFRTARAAHRLEVLPRHNCWTLFVTGPRIRDWGFHCARSGWVHWQTFTDPTTGGATVGLGCGEG